MCNCSICNDRRADQANIDIRFQPVKSNVPWNLKEGERIPMFPVFGDLIYLDDRLLNEPIKDELPFSTVDTCIEHNYNYAMGEIVVVDSNGLILQVIPCQSKIDSSTYWVVSNDCLIEEEVTKEETKKVKVFPHW